MEATDRTQAQHPWKRHAIAAAVCLVLLGLGWALHGANAPLSLALHLASFAAGLWTTLPETARSLASRNIDVDFLMILVAAGAFALGHPEEGAMLLVLFTGSRAMEAYARERTHESIADLMRDLPRRAIRLRGEEQEEVAVDSIAPGDVLIIRPGEKFPVDARIAQGTTTLDLSAITGEAEPESAGPGREVPSGAVNGGGLVRAVSIRRAGDSAWQKVVALIENAPARQSPAQELSDKAGRWFTWVILSASATGFLLWWLVGGLAVADAAYRAMVLLVAGSPCALVLSIPSAVLAAISWGARRGLLFNGGIGLSNLMRVNWVALDKTGTLSTGFPGVVRVEGSRATEAELLRAAMELARASTHPASRSVVRYLEECLGPVVAVTPEVTDIREESGFGMTGLWRGRRIFLGRDNASFQPRPSEEHYSRVILRVEDEMAARFLMAESARAEAAEAIAGLHALGLRTLIVSGDRQPSVDLMAREVGIDEALGGLCPTDKFRVVQERAAAGGIAMVGDGVNDAPALSAATVGVAMGIRGSAATLAQADIVLVKDRLTDLVRAFGLARRTRAIIRQNLAIAIGAASVMVILAAMGKLPLVLGVFGHEGGTVLVVLNSLRLLFEPRHTLAVAEEGAGLLTSANRPAISPGRP